ncbi:hypothetical protein IJ076_03515 [Candidatus Saccharibacteria bacterium]|nr:hypothetical protein [Candidatus Saccharibacteria bacterium]
MNEDFQKLVCARLRALPKGYSISIGGSQNVTKEEAIEHVNSNDEIGQLLVAVDRHYFDMIKAGKIYEGITD